MATMTKLAILLCAAAAIFAQDFENHLEIHLNDLETQELEHIIEKRAPNDQSAIFGSNGPNDRLLLHETVDVKKAILQIRKKDITFPKDAVPSSATITCIKIFDQLRTGKNADFKISSGGVGQKFAIINMRSKRGEPIKYIVHIYGR